MKIHYISDHSILEYDEVQLLLDLGHEVFSNGAYVDPKGHITLPRPALSGGKFYKEYADLSRRFPRTRLPKELIDPFDVIIVMHGPRVIAENWENIRHKQVVWRTIGQSVNSIEDLLKTPREEGLKIIRYSPKERNLENYIGEDAMIRFYKNENEHWGWDGKDGGVVTFSQSLKGRRDFCHYDEIFPVIEKFNGKIYGPGNEDVGKYNGGAVPYEDQISIMQKSAVMIYGGTWPASYTLSFIEALMTGLPIVAISKKLAHIEKFEYFDFYEVDEIMALIDGAVCDSVEDMTKHVDLFLNNESYSFEMSSRQRALALSMFSRANIIKQWKEFLDDLV
jgi:glycosyltransferase involved in cell wall biosynthesis